MNSCLLIWTRAFHHCRKLRAFAMGHVVPLQPPSPSPEHGEEPQHKDGPGPSAMEAVAQCRPCSAEIPSGSFHMNSLRPLLKSHMWLRISACKAASGWLRRSPNPFSPQHRWARSIPQQGVPQGSSAQSRQLISSPSLCAHPYNFITQTVCLITGQGK